MRTLSLIRHAKSSWEGNFIDMERPLSDRGLRDANLLTNKLLNTQFNPDAIFSSPANRALTTCRLFMDKLHFSKELLIITDELYDFGGQRVVRFIRDLDDSLQDVLIFGHNHAFTAIANDFGDTYIDNVPTCGLVKIQFETTSWKNINQGHTIMTLFPKELRS